MYVSQWNHRTETQALKKQIPYQAHSTDIIWVLYKVYSLHFEIRCKIAETHAYAIPWNPGHQTLGPKSGDWGRWLKWIHQKGGRGRKAREIRWRGMHWKGRTFHELAPACAPPPPKKGIRKQCIEKHVLVLVLKAPPLIQPRKRKLTI